MSGVDKLDVLVPNWRDGSGFIRVLGLMIEVLGRIDFSQPDQTDWDSYEEFMEPIDFGDRV